jgi:hypothetical protein
MGEGMLGSRKKQVGGYGIRAKGEERPQLN